MSVWTRPADDGNNEHGRRRVREEHVRARDDVNARGDHRCGVDERADRRWAFHGVRQPDVEWELRRLTAGAHKEEQACDGECAQLAHRFCWPVSSLVKERNEIQRPKGAEEQEHPQHETEVTNAIDDESLLASVGGGFFQEIESDEEVAREADALPADEEKHVVRGQDQDEHEKHEQIEVGEEAVIAPLMGHVADRINVDEPADAGDDHEHDDGELISLEVEARSERACGYPGEVLFYPGNLLGCELCKFAEGLERTGE